MVDHYYDPRFKQIVFLFMIQLFQDVSVLFCQMINGIIMSEAHGGGANELYARRTEYYKRTFHQFAAQLTERTFRRMFRMTPHAFDQLCDKFVSHLGVYTFRPQCLLDGEFGRTADECTWRVKCMFNALRVGSGGLISGETVLAIFIRFLAGGSYLDIAGCYGIHFNTVFELVDKALGWIDGMSFGMVSIENYLSGQDCAESRLRTTVMAGFAKRANGVLAGCIGVLDGWTPKVQSHGLTNLFTRKGFFAINVQIIGDHLKRVLWLSDKFSGSTHDSPAFQQTRLYELLVEKSSELYERLEYLLADSAYSIRSFLQVPFPRTFPNTHQDNFNCYLSKLRILSECVIGELCARWGIFQRRMAFDLEKCRRVIRGSAKIHNFLVDYREVYGEHADNFYISFDQSSNVPLFKEFNPDPKKIGRPTEDETLLADRGRHLRTKLTTSLNAAGLVRGRESRKRRRTYGLQNDK